MRDVAVVVPAAGRGERLGPGLPKSLRHLGGEPLLVHAVRRLAAAPSVAAVVVAAPPGARDEVTALLAPLFAAGDGPGGPVSSSGPGASGPPVLVVVAGAATRTGSVRAALAAVPAHLPIVLVHDAARPLTPPSLVEQVAAAVRGGVDAVIPVLPVTDTIKQVAADGTVHATVDRTTLRAVQTPQGFRRAVLVAAYDAADGEATDDAGLVERLGVPVRTVPGDAEALKVTRPFDLLVAEALLRGGS